MGIRGLTSFISEKSDTYLKPFQLNDSYLIVDGYNAVYSLFMSYTEDSGVFGGDYDAYYEVVKEFFTSLFTCKVIPIVIFDGGHEKKKLKTVHERNRSRLLKLSRFLQTDLENKFIPLFIVNVFQYVIWELDIICIQCYFEADKEIAGVAKTLNCPVLSYDSDFFIYDVLYIPFNTLILQPEELKISDSEKKFFLKCSIFILDNFLNDFKGLKKCMLPLMPVILGNDYIHTTVFNKSFYDIYIPKDKHENYLHGRILAVLNWLKNENLESAKSYIFTHLKKKKTINASKVIINMLNDYSSYSCTIMPLLNIEDIGTNKEENHEQCKVNQTTNNEEQENNFIFKLPNKFIKLFQACKIQSFVMDMLSLNCYFLPTQVEDLNKPSSHIISLPIISAIYIILKSFASLEKNILNIYLKMKNNYCTVKLPNLNFTCFEEINIDNLLNESNIVKIKFFYKILDLTENDITAIENFDNDWLLFIISFIYWIKNLDSEISVTCVHALLFMVICIFVQNNVDYYKNYLTFMNCKSKTTNKLITKEVLTDNYSNYKISELLNNIPQAEVLILTKSLIKLRKMSNHFKKNDHFISVVHLYACFQSCLFHILQLNSILNYPLPNLNIAQFYCGTLLYNLHYKFYQQTDVINYIMKKLSVTPNIANLYKFLLHKLQSYIPSCTNIKVKKTRKKHKKKIKKKTEVFVKSSKVEESSDTDYFDNENLFSVLQSLSHTQKK